jgi:hypothetical protein
VGSIHRHGKYRGPTLDRPPPSFYTNALKSRTARPMEEFNMIVALLAFSVLVLLLTSRLWLA